MIEDKLTREERVRLESVAQSIAKNGPAPIRLVLEDADKISKFIFSANVPGSND